MQIMENYLLKDNLLSNIKVAAYFILLYEHFEDVVIATVRDVYSCPCILDGKLFSDIDDEYICLLMEKLKNETDNRTMLEASITSAQLRKEVYRKEIVGKKDEQDARVFRGSLNWLQKNQVISEEERRRILAIRKRRNMITHEMLREIGKGMCDEDARMIADLLKLQQRIHVWRFQEIEMPVMEIRLPKDADPEDAMGIDDALLMCIFQTLFCEENPQFKEALDKELAK